MRGWHGIMIRGIWGWSMQHIRCQQVFIFNFSWAQWRSCTSTASFRFDLSWLKFFSLLASKSCLVDIEVCSSAGNWAFAEHGFLPPARWMVMWLRAHIVPLLSLLCLQTQSQSPVAKQLENFPTCLPCPLHWPEPTAWQNVSLIF